MNEDIWMFTKIDFGCLQIPFHLSKQISPKPGILFAVSFMVPKMLPFGQQIKEESKLDPQNNTLRLTVRSGQSNKLYTEIWLKSQEA